MTKDRLDPALLELAGILVLGAMAPLVDSTIVNVAIRVLGRELHATAATVQWVSTGYLLALALAVPVAGWTVDRYGARRMWPAACGSPRSACSRPCCCSRCTTSRSAGASVIMAGLLLAPQGLGSLLARGAGALTDRLGPRPILLAAIAATTLGTVPFALAGRVSGGVLAAALVLRGLGLSVANLAVMVGAFQGLDRARVPHASGITRIAQQLGGSFGTAILAVVLQRQLAGHPGTPAAAYAHTFTWSLALTALAVVPTPLMPRRTAGDLAESGESVSAGFQDGKSRIANSETHD